VAEAVVDDLEAVEIKIERGEPAVAAPLLEVVEPPAEPLNENGSIVETGQRVAEPVAAQPLLCSCSPRCGGQRPRDAGRAPACASHRNTAAQVPPVGAVLVPDSVLVVHMIGLP